MASAKDRLYSFGGCAYRQQVHVRHASALAALACAPVKGGPILASIDYKHTSNLPAGRALWLREQLADMEGRLSWSVSVDSDTTFDAAQLHHEITGVDGQFAIGIAPVRIGGTEDLCNVCITDEDERISATKITERPGVGRRAFLAELRTVLDGDRIITSGGFGVVVFNLRWFRQCWPDPAPEHVSIDTGEDIEFCRSVRARGGLIRLLAVQTDHFAWGERQTR